MRTELRPAKKSWPHCAILTQQQHVEQHCSSLLQGRWREWYDFFIFTMRLASNGLNETGPSAPSARCAELPWRSGVVENIYFLLSAGCVVGVEGVPGDGQIDSSRPRVTVPCGRVIAVGRRDG
ncbi:hypothetical protein J3458_018927 [Metarhizium acridum]|uniref:uncharacterized protein n=1 Tax=Metarhizium acridum TaxID=92637 RepID=UPI001C6D0CBC|nr:hypothetical protein J3458_018927 [Metarhizium acridum]